MKNNNAHAFIVESIKPQQSLIYALGIIKDKVCGLNDDCKNCKSIDSQLNPNLAMVNGYEEKIKIEAIESLKDFCSTVAFDNQPKMIIIQGIENITPKAANAFLKFIEEPDLDVIFTFTTTNANAVLETIQTRCQITHLKDNADEANKNEILNHLLNSKPFEIEWQNLSREEIKSLLIKFTQSKNSKEDLELNKNILEAINLLNANVNINLIIAKVLNELK